MVFNRLRRWLLLWVWLAAAIACLGQNRAGNVDVFCGAELNYNDTDVKRLYNVMIDLTPGVKWNMGKGWMATGQLSYAAVNYGYAEKYNYLRLGIVAISKELAFGKDQHLKFTGGLFSRERYGLDARWMMPINSWLMMQAQAGLTSTWWCSTNEQMFEGKKWNPTAIAGANVWIDKWATEFRLSGGRYINEDYGIEGEVYCHFNHCSVGVFAQYHEAYHTPLVKNMIYRRAVGFMVVMMLPPYQKPDKKFRVRPASNFRLTYNAQSDGYSMKKYRTDPEENEREYQTNVRWGTGLYR